ncbi:hypothetical protein BDF19DRAFT_425673 [Syncephalis fuscata]|nr:hypothetical protein BDF19DRAFT_425673 [Syncephalis fuscata]
MYTFKLTTLAYAALVGILTTTLDSTADAVPRQQIRPNPYKFNNYEAILYNLQNPKNSFNAFEKKGLNIVNPWQIDDSKDWIYTRITYNGFPGRIQCTKDRELYRITTINISNLQQTSPFGTSGCIVLPDSSK